MHANLNTKRVPPAAFASNTIHLLARSNTRPVSRFYRDQSRLIASHPRKDIMRMSIHEWTLAEGYYAEGIIKEISKSYECKPSVEGIREWTSYGHHAERHQRKPPMQTISASH